MGGDWRDKAGGLMCVGHSSSALSDGVRALLDVGVCGVILWGTAFRDTLSAAELIYALKRYAARPLFVGVFHQTLEHVREDSPLALLPLGHRLYASADVELARHVGEVLGQELRKAGVDMTLGPCVNVDRVRRACGPESGAATSVADLAAKMGAAMILGQQSEGVAACATYFPGCASGARGADGALPTIPHKIAALEETELKPFRAAAAARVAGMMVGHTHFTALDDRAPASLSRAIIFGLLRQRLGYRGLVMIDDVDSGALSERYDHDVIARLGVASGADCFLCMKRPETAFDLVRSIERGVSEGEILPERIESARRRIAPLLHRYVRDSAPAVPPLAVGSDFGAPRASCLDPGIDAPTHMGPGALTADEKQHEH